MNFNDLTNRLSEKQKEQLINAKTQEDLDELFTPDKLLLTEDQLGKVAGGSCFRPSCPVCGSEYIEGTQDCPNHCVVVRCPRCGKYLSAEYDSCPYCPSPDSYRTI